jgi:S-DNA-T family DNA segregation ATPase FtsK/SpoIIIE
MTTLSLVPGPAPADRFAGLRSIFDPLFIGIDEFGQPVYLPMMFRNLLGGCEPGGGKSNLLNVCLGQAGLDPRCRLVLLDGKLVELGQWRHIADVFVGPDIHHALLTLARVQQVVNNRCQFLLSSGRRKTYPNDRFDPIVLAIDELAYFSATAGDRKQQELFAVLLRDLVGRGRAVGVMVIAMTQRPSSDIIPTSLRDLFAWRWAGRCTTDVSSDIVLGHGWAAKNWSANRISPTNPGLGLLIGEGGVPMYVKVAHLSDADCARIATHAATLRNARNRVRDLPDAA